MDRAALQSQISANLAYAGEALTYAAGGPIYGAFEPVSIEDPGVDVAFQGQGHRLSYSLDGVDTPPRAGTVLTSVAGIRYRILNKPLLNPTTNQIECLVEELNP